MFRPPGGGILGFLLYSPAQDEGHIKWPSLRAELAMNFVPRRPGGRLFIDGRPDRSMVPRPDASKVGRAFRMGRLSKNASRNLPLEWDVVSRWRCFAESASHSGRSKWDTLSQRRSNGKLRPIIRSRNGMHFPNESKTGKCIPQSALKVGRRFPVRLKRKMHPGICAQSGMRFPVEGLRGKCVPESTLEMGCSFPMRHSTENTFQKWPLSWDKISAASRILKNETRRWRK